MTRSRPQKRVCSSKDEADVGRDRLSIIVNILSCMPTIDAVRTVLLRRFGNLWTFVHSLKFYMDEYLAIFPDDSPRAVIRDKYNNIRYIRYMDDDYPGNRHIKWFGSFVRNVLILHQKLSIDIFHLCIGSDYREVFDVRVLLRFALNRQAKEIRLTTSYYDYYRGLIFPNNFKLTSQFLVTLDLDYFVFKGEFQVELVSLKKLSLNHVYMSDANFLRFVSGCSSLQELVIVNPFWMNNISFSAPNIVKLSLVIIHNDDDDDYNRDYQLSLNVPNLRNLYLEFDVCLLNITDVSSVHDCYVNYSTFRMNDDEVVKINQMMFGKLQGTEVLQLSCDASKKFLHSIQLELLQSRWKRVVMELDHFCASCLSGMYHLIESSKQLEELIIYTTKDFLACINLDRIKLLRPCVTSQLKTITLHGCLKSWRESWKYELQLIEFLLKTASSLDKLVIYPVKPSKKADEVEFFNRVLSFERSSPTVRVIFA